MTPECVGETKELNGCQQKGRQGLFQKINQIPPTRWRPSIRCKDFTFFSNQDDTHLPGHTEKTKDYVICALSSVHGTIHTSEGSKIFKKLKS